MVSELRSGVLLDLDGTLVDSVFHHVMAWDGALAAAGHDVPLWRIHAGIGMGTSRLLPWLLGEDVEGSEKIAASHERRFLEASSRLRPTNGAVALVADLRRREVAFQVATSSGTEVREALLAALGVGDLPTADADDVGSPKPAPDLLLAGCAALGVEPDRVTLIGDSPWDAEAAGQVGIRTIAVRCGGFGDDRLLHAGADDVVDDPRALVGRL